MADCLFCKIIDGEIPCTKIAENEKFLAFLDIAPINKGHTLVIPKKHCQDIADFPSEQGEEWFRFVQEIVALVKKGVQAEGVNIGMNNGAIAGQVVFHQHTHIIPRFSKDGHEHWKNKPSTPEELAQIAKKIVG